MGGRLMVFLSAIWACPQGSGYTLQSVLAAFLAFTGFPLLSLTQKYLTVTDCPPLNIKFHAETIKKIIFPSFSATGTYG